MNKPSKRSRSKKLLKSYVAPDLIQQVDEAANNCGMTRSEWVCALLERELNGKRFPPHSQDFGLYKIAVGVLHDIGNITAALTYITDQIQLGRIQGFHPEALNESLALNRRVHQAILKALLNHERANENVL